MCIVRKTAVISLSLAAFIFMLPFEFVQVVAKRLAGKNKSGISLIAEVYAEVCYTLDECLEILLPDAQDIKEEVKVLTAEQKKAIQDKAKVEFDPELEKDFHFYVSSQGIAALETVRGKWGPVRFIASFDNQGKIKDVVILELTEKRGKPIKERKFLDQYSGKSAADPIKLNKDIKGIAGATISSRQMTDGVRKIANVYELFYKK